MRIYLAYSRSLEVDKRSEWCACSYTYNNATGEVSSVSLCSRPSQKRAADGSFISRKDGEVLVWFKKDRLITMSKARSATETAGIQLDEPISLHPATVSEGSDDRGGAHAKPIWDLQYSSDQPAGAVSAL